MLNDGQAKCAQCKRKFSPKKYLMEQQIIEAFLQQNSATQTAKKLNLHFNTVKKRYDHLRKAIALYADEKYQENTHLIEEYDEYLYLPKSVKVFDKNMHKVQNFLTLCYQNRVYSLMMPTPQKYDFNLTEAREQKKLSKFLRFHKIAKLHTLQNQITAFWDYFENFITQYKGVSEEQFIYYLKEAEFRFNYSEKQQREILFTMTSNS